MPEQVEEARVGTQRPHALWERSVSLITSLHVSVSWCLCSVCMCVCVCLPPPGSPFMNSLLGAKREHTGLDFESGSEKLGQGKGLAGRLLTEEQLKVCGTVSTTHMPSLLWLLVLSVRPILVSSLPSTSHRQPQVLENAAPSFGCPQDFTDVQDSAVC